MRRQHSCRMRSLLWRVPPRNPLPRADDLMMCHKDPTLMEELVAWMMCCADLALMVEVAQGLEHASIVAQLNRLERRTNDRDHHRDSTAAPCRLPGRSKGAHTKEARHPTLRSVRLPHAAMRPGERARRPRTGRA